MIRGVAVVGLALLRAGELAAETDLIAVPSGQPVSFVEIIRDAPGPAGLTYRFRFLAPEIARDGGTIDAFTAAADMDHLCQSFALPRIAAPAPQPAQIVISLSDRLVPFGAASPEATQFFEAFSIADGTCIWEQF